MTVEWPSHTHLLPPGRKARLQVRIRVSPLGFLPPAGALRHLLWDFPTQRPPPALRPHCLPFPVSPRSPPAHRFTELSVA